MWQWQWLGGSGRVGFAGLALGTCFIYKALCFVDFNECAYDYDRNSKSTLF
jgi:hypothetical protein